MVGLFSRIWANENIPRKQLDNKLVKSDALRGTVTKNKTADTMAGNKIPLVCNKSLDALPQPANREPCRDLITQHALKT